MFGVDTRTAGWKDVPAVVAAAETHSRAAARYRDAKAHVLALDRATYGGPEHDEIAALQAQVDLPGARLAMKKAEIAEMDARAAYDDVAAREKARIYDDRTTPRRELARQLYDVLAQAHEIAVEISAHDDETEALSGRRPETLWPELHRSTPQITSLYDHRLARDRKDGVI